MTESTSLIEEIRKSSRSLARDWGFMGEGFAHTDLSPSAVHALLEIEEGNVLARDLAIRLRLDKSSVSRMLRKLVDTGDVCETENDSDTRTRLLSLTRNGKERVAKIHAHARAQVKSALMHLHPGQDRIVLNGLRLYSDALASPSRTSGYQSPYQIVTGYQIGLIARITQMHMHYYGKVFNFGQRFESLVATGLADFVNRLERPMNNIWTLVHREEIVGSIAIDGEHLGQRIAHLRWFIVDESFQSGGSGRELLSTAVAFADRQGFDEIHLWTFSSLSAARHLYESYNFKCVAESEGNQWGRAVLEQRFVRVRPGLSLKQ